MSWQKCPICKGTGSVGDYEIRGTCTTCNGNKIISTLTGKPPEKQEK